MSKLKAENNIKKQNQQKRPFTLWQTGRAATPRDNSEMNENVKVSKLRGTLFAGTRDKTA